MMRLTLRYNFVSLDSSFRWNDAPPANSAFRILHFAFCIPHFAFCILHSAFRIS